MIQQWCASTLQFPHVTGLQTTFTDYFLHNTKYLLLFFFLLLQPWSLYKPPHNIDKNNCFLSCRLMRFYTKEKEDILNYYNSNQHRSCNTRSGYCKDL